MKVAINDASTLKSNIGRTRGKSLTGNVRYRYAHKVRARWQPCEADFLDEAALDDEAVSQSSVGSFDEINGSVIIRLG